MKFARCWVMFDHTMLDLQHVLAAWFTGERLITVDTWNAWCMYICAWLWRWQHVVEMKTRKMDPSKCLQTAPGLEDGPICPQYSVWIQQKRLAKFSVHFVSSGTVSGFLIHTCAKKVLSYSNQCVLMNYYRCWWEHEDCFFSLSIINYLAKTLSRATLLNAFVCSGLHPVTQWVLVCFNGRLPLNYRCLLGCFTKPKLHIR